MEEHSAGVHPLLGGRDTCFVLSTSDILERLEASEQLARRCGISYPGSWSFSVLAIGYLEHMVFIVVMVLMSGDGEG